VILEFGVPLRRGNTVSVTRHEILDERLCRGNVDSVGLGDRRGCEERKELLESEQWLAL
jgi:hypothetical protein